MCWLGQAFMGNISAQTTNSVFLTRVVYLDKLKNSVGGKGAPNTIVTVDTKKFVNFSHDHPKSE